MTADSLPHCMQHYEMRSYWIGGLYSHSTATHSTTEQVVGERLPRRPRTGYQGATSVPVTAPTSVPVTALTSASTGPTPLSPRRARCAPVTCNDLESHPWRSGLGHHISFKVDTFADELVAPDGVPTAGNLSVDIKPTVLALGRRVMHALPSLPTEMPLLRIDVACCLEHEHAVGGIFVNEMSWFPDLLIHADGQPEQTIARVAEAYHGYAHSSQGLWRL